MHKNQFHSVCGDVACNVSTGAATKQQYVAPTIEIINIETDQNILGGSQLPSMPGEDWPTA